MDPPQRREDRTAPGVVDAPCRNRKRGSFAERLPSIRARVTRVAPSDAASSSPARIPRSRLTAPRRSSVRSRLRGNRTSRGRGATRRCRTQGRVERPRTFIRQEPLRASVAIPLSSMSSRSSTSPRARRAPPMTRSFGDLAVDDDNPVSTVRRLVAPTSDARMRPVHVVGRVRRPCVSRPDPPLFEQERQILVPYLPQLASHSDRSLPMAYSATGGLRHHASATSRLT